MRENGFQERKVTMRKINFGKKGIALMLSGIVALSGMTVISTQAANRTDKPFELKLDSQKTDSGDWRTKDNKINNENSLVILKYQQGPISMLPQWHSSDIQILLSHTRWKYKRLLLLY